MTDILPRPAWRRPSELFGAWEAGLLAMMVLLFAVVAVLNPAFFGTTYALHALFRDSARVAVMAVGMTFVIANKDLDLSVGSTLGLVAVVFSLVFDPNRMDMGVVPAIGVCIALGH